MATNVSSVTKHFPSAQNGFTTTTSGSTASGAATVGLNSVAGYTNGETVVMVIEPTSATAKQTFTGVIDTSGVQITGVVWTAGTNQTHAAGVTVVDYETATHWSMVAKGLLVEHDQDGTHQGITTDTITATTGTFTNLTISGSANDGWVTTGGTHSVATTYNAGNRSFTIDTSTDLSAIVSPGMRYRTTRDTVPPTQCADLESGSSHYASKSSPTGITFTTTWSAEAWIKLESYSGNKGIVSKFSSSGWVFYIDGSGTLIMYADDAGTADTVQSYQSVPLGKWVHVAGTHTVNSGGALYIDGVAVPSEYTNGTTTAIVQTDDLEVGAYNSSNFFDGKLADVRVWSDIRTATEIQDNMYGYPSDTTGLVAHFKLNGDFTDATSNNDLTAQNSAVATDVDNPWNPIEYGIITAVSATDMQVFCPSGYGIPNETLTAPFYSTQSAPFGFPRGRDKWQLMMIRVGQETLNSGITTYQTANKELVVPVGAWELSHDSYLQVTLASTAGGFWTTTLSSDGSTATNPEGNGMNVYDNDSAAAVSLGAVTHGEFTVNLTAQTTFTYLVKISTTSPSALLSGFINTDFFDNITATCAYL